MLRKKNRVLWFSVTPSLYAENGHGYNGGGWIGSLERLVRNSDEIDLAVAFEHGDHNFKITKNNVCYYPISVNVSRSKMDVLKKLIDSSAEENLLLPECVKVIEDFKPDIIHVFGSEWSFGLVTQLTNIPVVIHLQGNIPACLNAYYPPGINLFDLIRFNGFNIIKSLRDLMLKRALKKRAEREERILKCCRFYMGRTKWDHDIVKLYNPEAKYFHCDEVLRPNFSLGEWNYVAKGTFKICTTISPVMYKGADMIIKAAKLLKQNSNLNFEWIVMGVSDLNFFEWKLSENLRKLSINLMGVVSPEKLKEELLNSDLYVHTSYVDNSPNSVCEAQILGLPVICSNVGGVSSLIKDGISGLLYPANDIYSLVSNILLIAKNPVTGAQLGSQAKAQATERHKHSEILRRLLTIYDSIIFDKDSPLTHDN